MRVCVEGGGMHIDLGILCVCVCGGGGGGCTLI